MFLFALFNIFSTLRLPLATSQPTMLNQQVSTFLRKHSYTIPQYDDDRRMVPTCVPHSHVSSFNLKQKLRITTWIQKQQCICTFGWVNFFFHKNRLPKLESTMNSKKISPRNYISMCLKSIPSLWEARRFKVKVFGISLGADPTLKKINPKRGRFLMNFGEQTFTGSLLIFLKLNFWPKPKHRGQGLMDLMLLISDPKHTGLDGDSNARAKSNREFVGDP